MHKWTTKRVYGGRDAKMLEEYAREREKEGMGGVGEERSERGRTAEAVPFTSLPRASPRTSRRRRGTCDRGKDAYRLRTSAREDRCQRD